MYLPVHWQGAGVRAGSNTHAQPRRRHMQACQLPEAGLGMGGQCGWRSAQPRTDRTGTRLAPAAWQSRGAPEPRSSAGPRN